MPLASPSISKIACVLFLLVQVFFWGYLPKAQAFTLLTENALRFPVDKVVVNLTADDCSGATRLSAHELWDVVGEAIGRFWNTAPTSALRLEQGRFTNITFNGTTNGYNAGSKNSVQNSILVGCNDDISGFSTHADFVAISGLEKKSDHVVGYIVLNTHANSSLRGYSREEMVILLGHELGHALGLGHGEDEESLMFWDVRNKKQEYLSQDDVDAVTYLYPIKEINQSCGTVDFISTPPRSGGRGSFFLSLCIGAMVVSLISWSRRRISQLIN